MGDPRKQRKKYKTPSHPWNKERIGEERKLLKEYGLVNKKELWKMETIMLDFKEQAKRLIRRSDEQARKEEALLMEKLARLKLLPSEAKPEDVLDLSIRDILERRLQTLIMRKSLARTPKQARQFIVHGHITVRGKKTTVPSCLVKADEEGTISFIPLSSLADNDHPERAIKKTEKGAGGKKKTKEEVFEEILEKGPKAEEKAPKGKEPKKAPKKEKPKEEPKKEKPAAKKKAPKEEKKKGGSK